MAKTPPTTFGRPGGLRTGQARVQLAGVAPRSATIQRTRYALLLLTQMLPPYMINQKVSEKFGITEKAAEKYLSMAKETLAKMPPPELEERRAQMRAAFGQAYVECMAKGSHGPAVRALRELALLDGLYPEHEVNRTFGTGKGAQQAENDIANTDPDSVRERMAKLMTKHAESLAALHVAKTEEKKS